METNKRPESMGVLISAAPADHGHGVVTRQRTRRNPWVVIAFFGLVFASWINGLM